MKRFLFFDDDKTRHNEFDKIVNDFDVEVLHTFTPTEAIAALKSNKFDTVFLDHDMDFNLVNNGNGMDVAEFISLHLDRLKYPDMVVIHSWNIECARKMESVLINAGLNTKRVPFSSA